MEFTVYSIQCTVGNVQLKPAVGPKLWLDRSALHQDTEYRVPSTEYILARLAGAGLCFVSHPSMWRARMHAQCAVHGPWLTWRMKMHFGKNMISGPEGPSGDAHNETKGQTLQRRFHRPTMQIGEPEKRNAHTYTAHPQHTLALTLTLTFSKNNIALVGGL